MAIANPAAPDRQKSLEFLVDSGAAYSLVPRPILEELGIRAVDRRAFTLANGDIVERDMGNALFFYQGKEAASPVIFGEDGDSDLLGTVTLETFGFVLDPFRRELRPLPMILG
jgi:clan AA aspartic protease